MRILYRSTLAIAGLALLGACSHGGLAGRDRPDEFAVQRQAPLVVPPDFALSPPKPGAPRPAEGTAAQQALEALFGGTAPRSASETQRLQTTGADRAAAGARSVVSDPETKVVDKGTVTQTILAVPEGDGQEASVTTPQ
jgi:hypothetical protein